MASLVNKYFHQNQKTEQNLVDSMIQESIQVMGKTYYYLPRHMLQEDLILGEDVMSKFELAIPIEMYMVDTQGFEGDKEMFSKFGLEIHNSYKLVVAKARWEKEVKRVFDGTNGPAPFQLVTSLRPQEGDLIYDPLTTFLMEIKFVDHDVEFYQLGRNYQYYLSCEAFQYENEQLATGIQDIDAFNVESKDLLVNQIMMEDGSMMTDEDTNYLLQDISAPAQVTLSDGSTKTQRVVQTNDYVSEGANINFNPKNPFGSDF